MNLISFVSAPAAAEFAKVKICFREAGVIVGYPEGQGGCPR